MALRQGAPPSLFLTLTQGQHYLRWWNALPLILLATIEFSFLFQLLLRIADDVSDLATLRSPRLAALVAALATPKMFAFVGLVDKAR